LAASLADWDRASRLKKAFVLTTAAIATLSFAARYIFFASVITLGVTSWIEWRRSLSRAA